MTGNTAHVPMSLESIKDMLITTHGDLFQAACLMRCSFREFDQMIRRSTELTQFVKSIEQIKSDPEYDKLSEEQFNRSVESLTKQYKFEGLQIIHEIATGEALTAADREVKLRAAMQLRGNDSHATRGDGTGGLLAELAREYLAEAPRISEIRMREVTLSLTTGMGPQNQPSVLNVEVLPPPDDAEHPPQ